MTQVCLGEREVTSQSHVFRGMKHIKGFEHVRKDSDGVTKQKVFEQEVSFTF